MQLDSITSPNYLFHRPSPGPSRALDRGRIEGEASTSSFGETQLSRPEKERQRHHEWLIFGILSGTNDILLGRWRKNITKT